MVRRESLVTWDLVVRAEARRRGIGDDCGSTVDVDGIFVGEGAKSVVWKRERRVRVVLIVDERAGGGILG